jgi:hypothetical protein
MAFSEDQPLCLEVLRLQRIRTTKALVTEQSEVIVNLTPDRHSCHKCCLPSSQSRSAYEGSPGRIAPGNESAIAGHAILTDGKTVTAELEVVVDRSVNREKLLRMPG